MKKVLLLAVAMILISSAASAGGRLELFTDTAGTAWCAYPPPVQYANVHVYLLATPPTAGFRATECKIVIPDPNASILNPVYHDDMNLAFGDWATGMSLSFVACQLTDPTLVVDLTVIALAGPWSTDCQVIEMLPRDDSGFLGFATCDTGFPPEAGYHAYDVYLNCDPCPDIVGTQNKSWGAIKDLYSE